MNLDSLSFALAEISFAVANLTKKTYKSTVAGLNHVSMKIPQLAVSSCILFNVLYVIVA